MLYEQFETFAHTGNIHVHVYVRDDACVCFGGRRQALHRADDEVHRRRRLVTHRLQEQAAHSVRLGELGAAGQSSSAITMQCARVQCT